MKITIHTAETTRTGTSVASRSLIEDELEPDARRESLGLVELSRAEPTRGSLPLIARTH